MKFLELHKILQNNIYSILSRLLYFYIWELKWTIDDSGDFFQVFEEKWWEGVRNDIDFFSFPYNEMDSPWSASGSNHCVLTAGDSFNIQHWDVLKYASHMMGWWVLIGDIWIYSFTFTYILPIISMYEAESDRSNSHWHSMWWNSLG